MEVVSYFAESRPLSASPYINAVYFSLWINILLSEGTGMTKSSKARAFFWAQSHGPVVGRCNLCQHTALFGLDYNTAQAWLTSKATSVREGCSMNVLREEMVNQWSCTHNCLGNPRHGFNAEAAGTVLLYSQHRVAFLCPKPLLGWLGFARAQMSHCSLGRRAAAWLQVYSPAVGRSQCHVSCPSTPWSSLFCLISFLMPITSRASGGATCLWTHIAGLLAPWEVPGASFQQELTSPERSRARLCLPWAVSVGWPHSRGQLGFLAAGRRGLFFKTLLKELLFKIHFHIARGLLSISPFISKQVKSAKAESEKHAPKELYLETG